LVDWLVFVEPELTLEKFEPRAWPTPPVVLVLEIDHMFPFVLGAPFDPIVGVPLKLDPKVLVLRGRKRDIERGIGVLLSEFY